MMLPVPAPAGDSKADIPPSQWRDRFQEFKAFLFLQIQKPHAQTREILLDFASRFTGILSDWWISLGEYRQLMFLQTESIEAALSQLYAEFCGQEAQIVEKARSEFFKMQCCSMDKSDLEVHFQKMSKRFYLIGGINDPNLKQAFISSIPEPLGDETSRLLSAANKQIADITLGEICQFIFRAIDKMCSQNKFLQEYMKQMKQFDRICINKELLTKCPKNPTPGCNCSSCSSKPSSRIRKFRRKKGFRRNKFFSKKKGSWKFLRKRRNFSKRRSTRCFICGSKNHFMKNCPKAKTQKMITHINKETGISFSDNEIESLFSVDDEINDHTLCVLQLSESETESTSSESESDPEPDGQVLQMNAINIAQPTPMMTMKVITSKYANPIRVAALFDTGASYSIINPDILPSAYWKKKKQFFNAANGEVFCTELISKPIKLEFFPGCSLIHKIIGSKLPVFHCLGIHPKLLPSAR
ncbi:hypothetical protein TIFTF001_026049 [Ficus carica]|uniref:CCHC-type domain-containing protein n=1 Tax=Ficus carica TaxID=3494 RepID=A0AA88AXN6_FICCA|nr:hypothetical protein TIFTF001_026049 [Ficus carica]